MLQIASGKLFTNAPAQTNELRGVLYTNLQLFGRDPIVTVAGRLLPTGGLNNVNAVVYEMTELIEDPPTLGAIVSHGVEPYANDFAAIVSFALNNICTTDSALTHQLTGGLSPPTGVRPNRLVSRAFDSQVWCHDEDVGKLVNFVEDLIGLRRKRYLAAMRAIRTYVKGLYRIGDDPELTYTMLVASIESLVQDFKGYVPKWDDYAEDKRRKIDNALSEAGDHTRERVREAILDIEHVALTRRFCDFALDHIQPSYFREEAAGEINPVGRADLSSALRQAYDIRSKHIHSLRELPSLLTAGFHRGETLNVDGLTMLTFQGLTRLVRHVVTEFIRRQPKVDFEVYDYSSERAGIVMAPLAPKYWIGRTDSLAASSGRRRLEGFLVQIAACILGEENEDVTNLSKLLLEVEKLLPNMSETNRKPFLVLYVLFNELLIPETKLERYEEIRRRYKTEIEAPCAETMVLHLLLGTTQNWSLEKHQALHDAYLGGQGKRDRLKLPPILRSGLSLALAERYRVAEKTEQAHSLVSTAVENYPGYSSFSQLEASFSSDVEIPWKLVASSMNLSSDSVSERLSPGYALVASDVSDQS